MPAKFKRNLQTGFGISLLLLIVSSVISYSSIRNLIKSSELVDHTNQIILASENIISNIKDGETGQRGYLMTKQLDFLEPYNGAYERTMEAFNELKRLTADNKQQQDNCDSLESLINKRFNILNVSIDMVNRGEEINVFMLRDGLVYMQRARLLVKKIQNIENQLLIERTSEMKRFITYTPIVILGAALVSILITVFFFRKVNDDFHEKIKLNQELDAKDKQITERINTIEQIAQKISNGDYSVRLDEEQKDKLGALATSVNRMAISLDKSFSTISTREWIQSGLAKVSEKIAGEKDMTEISAELIKVLCEYTDSSMGAVYLDEHTGFLTLTGSYAVNASELAQRVKDGEGMIGQCYKDGREILISDIDDNLYTLFSAGKIRPNAVVLFPLEFEKRIIGVVELGTLRSFSDLHLQFLRAMSPIAGVTINMAYNRARLRELLEETQSQAEELQMQHRELETLNAEMEVQTEKLQSSEEELRVQQEELMETNQELEERSRLLEERNQLIVMRNLEIQKKSEELALSTRYKSEFLANMSHELRTPLNSVLLLSRLLKENNSANLTKEQIEFASVIHSSGTGLLQLIDEILDLSKIESGKLELDYETVAIDDIINDMRMLFAPMAKDKQVEFRIVKEESVPHTIDTDKLRLEQILKNLISNALKFTNKGSIEFHLKMSAKSDQLIEFSVKDTGIGIPEDKQHLIFEAFQQADGSTKRKYGGTGLGLSISRQLARLLAGDITLTSVVGKGSQFILTIPIHQNSNAWERVTSSQPDSDKGGTTESFKTKENKSSSPYIAGQIPEEIPDDRNNIMPRDRVLLIVEDDVAFAKALLEFARAKAYKGVIVVRGDQVIEMAKKFNPSGVLLDIQLPVKDGLTVMNELKENPATRHIPVHIMSSFEVKKESISRGAVDFIQKPLAFEQMNSVLEKIEDVVKRGSNKVLIVEDNSHHAKALGYFLESNGVSADITADVDKGIQSLARKDINCVILDMGIPGPQGYQTLEAMKQNEELANIPIIIFTGKSLSRTEEQRIRQYADSVIIKTAHSYQRILNEVSLFLHLMESGNKAPAKLGTLDEVLKNKIVLVADDDVRNIFALGKILEKHQVKVVTATDGKEALQLLNKNPEVDLVLMDMMMPEMDGYDAIRKIRQNPKWKNLPVIAVTAKAMTGDRDKCIEAGASDYISKPVDTDQLISLMRIWLYDKN